MARYTQSRTKLSRRVNRNLFLKGARSFSSKDDYAKTPFKNNNFGRKTRKTPSEFSKQLIEKQALKFTYGILEKQLANIFKKSFKQTGDTGQIALSLLERRLDNVVYKAGLANSRSQARQLVNHGHFTVNGQKVNIPSFTVKPGDVIQVKTNKTSKVFWQTFELQIPKEDTSWIDTSSKGMVKVLSVPTQADLPDSFNLAYIVEYYSRKVA